MFCLAVNMFEIVYKIGMFYITFFLSKKKYILDI